MKCDQNGRQKKIRLTINSIEYAGRSNSLSLNKEDYLYANLQKMNPDLLESSSNEKYFLFF